MSLLQSTPLRLSLALVALFSIAALASLAVSYVVARTTIESTIRDTLVQDLAGYMAAPSSAAVSTLVEAQGRVMDPSDRVVGYRDQFGRYFGNGAIVRTQAGFEVVALDRDDPVAEKYFILTEQVRGGYLTLAVSADARSNLRQTMTTVLVVSLLPTVLIALGGGVFLARRSARRLAALETTLTKLTTGDLSARVPAMSGLQDDLSQIATRIDVMAQAHEENVAALRQVSADIAHDLKTPIQRVAVLLEEAANAPAEQAGLLIAKAQDETTNISRIFHALLQISQMEGSPRVGNFGPVDLAEVTRDVADLYSPAAQERGQSLTIVQSNPQPVMGDRTLIAQLAANLIENALAHAGEGKEISIKAEDSTLIVADNGPGIPQDQREAVFRRLYRLERSRTTPGSGLGLSLVKAIARAHGATVALDDNAPGLKVTVRFAEGGQPVQG